MGLEQRIAAVPGVKHIYPCNLVGATYQRPTQQLGALVSSLLQDQYHWKVGDQIPLLAQTPQKNGSKSWTFEDVGTFRPPDMWASSFSSTT